MKTTTNYQDFEVTELDSEFAWFLWDRAVEAQDTGFLALEPVEKELMRARMSERSAFRREVRV